MTVARTVGSTSSMAAMASAKASSWEPALARTYRGASSSLSSRATVLRLMPTRRAMAALGRCSRSKSRLTSAQSFTLCTPSSLATSSGSGEDAGR